MALTDIDLTALPIPIHFGVDALASVGQLATNTGGTRALIVTDQGVRKAGHVARTESYLRAAGIESIVYDGVQENPSTVDVAHCVTAARDGNANFLIGLGGGSSMDAAKGCNFILTNGGSMQDYWGVDKASQAMLPFIAIPTTAGTGSECQRFALISDADTHQKMACGDPKAAARYAILDPVLTLTQPDFVTACTGIDAIVHAVETAVTSAATPASLRYSHEAFRLLITHMPTVLKSPDNVDARAAMQLGAALAGTAIEHSMLGAAHAAANPLTAHFNVIHGQAVCNTLPYVVRRNAQHEASSNGYRTLMQHAGLVSADATAQDAVDALLDQLDTLGRAANLIVPLAEFGVRENDIEMLSNEATEQWTGTFNPLALTAADYQALYRAAL
jgi:alcohol dehydrogenase